MAGGVLSAERYATAGISDSAMVVRVHEDRTETSVRRSMALSTAKGDIDLFFEILGDALPPPLRINDFAAIAAIFAAMKVARPLHIEGVVTAELLRNLEEFQEAWALWWPRLSVVPVSADEIVPDGPSSGPRKGVFAFSGGVDGVFALLRHLSGGAGLRTALPACAMLIHGFDVPLSEAEAFEQVRATAGGILEPLGVPLSVVRTNWKADLCGDWTKEFGTGLAACLHQFQGLASIGVVGADEDYAHLELPWGSNPITNHLLSGRYFAFHTEGGGFTRSERVRLICDRPEIAAKLRVCWEGPVTGGNCGLCEKCIRTQLNFMANDVEPLCFDAVPTGAQIRALRTINPVQLAYLTEISETARRNGIDAAWTNDLALAIARNKLMMPVRRIGRRLTGKLRRVAGF